MIRIIYFDGNYFKADPQSIEAYAPGAFKRKGVFETMLGVDGVVLDAAWHLKRLRAGLKVLHNRIPVIHPSILKTVLELNHLALARVRLMVWQEGNKTRTMVTAFPYKIPSKKVFRVCLIKTDRLTGARLANVKSLDYATFANAYKRAQARGFDEALLLNDRGYIFEASRANIFWIKDKVLYTPPLSSGCLKGITRQQVIRQAHKLKIRVKETNLTPEILKDADFAFLTNSLLGIKPIEFKQIKIAT